MSKPAQALPSSWSGRVIIKNDESVARLPLEAFTHQDVMPGDLIMVSGALIVPVLPSSSLAGGEISIPQPLAAQFDIKAGDDVPYERAPNGAVPTPAHSGAEGICFDDIGGLGPELARLREMVELPLIRPDLFAHLGITPPRGVLMSGPPGCGKTLIARALAAETKAAFFSIAGPEIADKHFGASEARLRDVFEAASAAAPAILFIDEIDSIAPAREGLSGDKQAERRMVAQLLTLMDGLDARGDVVVLAATNLPDLIDPALRRPGRFDREIILAAPDAKGRGDILAIHTKAMPLANDVELSDIARRCHGFVGADLASLAREAGIAALRRAPGGDVASLYVTRADFDAAFAEVRPSTLRAVQLDVPATTWDDIAGASKAKAALRQAVEWPLAYRVHYAQLGLSAPNGILLYGPPGTGKTLLARALANAAEANFIAINAGELLSLYLGESERAIRSVFARARASAPTVLFFDELDALAPRRSAQLSETASRVVAQLLTEMDGLTKGSGLFILGATNRMDQIDPAVLRSGRFDQKIEVPLPNAPDRAELLSLYLKGVAREQVDLEALAEACDGMSGADIAQFVRASKQLCLVRCIEGGDGESHGNMYLSEADFDGALQIFRGESDAG